MKRVLFYLPVVTPWWFDHMIAPLIRTLAPVAEVHVLVPKLWRNTGIEAAQLKACAELEGVRWHIIDGDGHRSLRTEPEDPEGLIAFVQSIDPDYTLCRSADIVTPAAFPGKVVHLIEAGSPPVPTGRWIWFQRDFWHHGAIASLSDAEREAVTSRFGDTWTRIWSTLNDRPFMAAPRDEALHAMGLPSDRKIIALALEYEHREAFTTMHNRFRRNLELLEHVVSGLDDRFFLAITDHPLNYRYVDNASLYAAIEQLEGRAKLVANPAMDQETTDLLVRHCDGLIVQNSKTTYAGAMFGKPILRLSHRPTAPWLRVQSELSPFLDGVAEGASGPVEDDARLWFAMHLTHEVFDPQTLSAEAFFDRMDRRFSADRLADGLDRLEKYHRTREIPA